MPHASRVWHLRTWLPVRRQVRNVVVAPSHGSLVILISTSVFRRRATEPAEGPSALPGLRRDAPGRTARRRGGLNLHILRDGGARLAARRSLLAKIYAAGSRRTHASRLRTVKRALASWGKTLFPWSAEKLTCLATALFAGEFWHDARSGVGDSAGELSNGLCGCPRGRPQFNGCFPLASPTPKLLASPDHTSACVIWGPQPHPSVPSTPSGTMSFFCVGSFRTSTTWRGSRTGTYCCSPRSSGRSSPSRR